MILGITLTTVANGLFLNSLALHQTLQLNAGKNVHGVRENGRMVEWQIGALRGKSLVIFLPSSCS